MEIRLLGRAEAAILGRGEQTDAPCKNGELNILSNFGLRCVKCGQFSQHMLKILIVSIPTLQFVLLSSGMMYMCCFVIKHQAVFLGK